MTTSTRMNPALPPTPAPRRARRGFAWIAAIAVLLAVLLTGVWYYLAGRLDAATRDLIRVAGGQGIAVSCDNQTVFGYPFRLGLRCDALGVDAPQRGLKATAGALRTAGQIYDPTRIVAELDGPLLVSAPGGPPLDLRWTLAQASAHLWTSGLDRAALVIEGPEVALAAPAGARSVLARSDHLEAHLRRRDAALDVAVSDRGVRMLLPALAGVPRFDVGLDATIEGAGDWLAGGRAGATLGEALAGKSGTLRTLRIAVAGPDAATPAPANAPSADLSGPFQVAADGTLSGTFQLALGDPEGIAGLVGALSPGLAGLTGTIASAVGFAGRTENGRTVIDIRVADGEARLGFIPLGRLPPLR